LVDYIYFSKDKIFYPNLEDEPNNHPSEKLALKDKYSSQIFEFGLSFLDDTDDFSGVNLAFYATSGNNIYYGLEILFDPSLGKGRKRRDTLINYYTLNVGSQFSMFKNFLEIGMRLKGGLAIVGDYYGIQNRNTLGFLAMPELYSSLNFSIARIALSLGAPQTVYKNREPTFLVDQFIDEEFWDVNFVVVPKFSVLIPLNKSPKSNQ
jgi:hypothetical protein